MTHNNIYSSNNKINSCNSCNKCMTIPIITIFQIILCVVDSKNVFFILHKYIGRKKNTGNYFTAVCVARQLEEFGEMSTSS